MILVNLIIELKENSEFMSVYEQPKIVLNIIEIFQHIYFTNFVMLQHLQAEVF